MSEHAYSNKISFISLGCQKALVDSEKIITELVARGYVIVSDGNPADLVIINTCGFMNAAIDESLETIADALKENSKVIVTGCLGSRKEFVLKHFPQVLYVGKPLAIHSLLRAVQKHLPLASSCQAIPAINIKLTPSHYAYLKISEGCSHRCTYCIIPQLRGKLKSRTLKSIFEEATALIESGVKELLIISQDTAAYGADLYGKQHFLKLVEMLSTLPAWIRLHYLYPYRHIDDVLPFMAEKKIVPYLDVPLQHASPRLLKSMRRPAYSEDMLKRIERWRMTCPDITIRSTFIVGFPGETEKDFQMLLHFLEEAKLDRVGCFQYSPVEGAAANRFPHQIPEAIKQARLDVLMKLQARISQQKLRRKIGKILPVLIDEVRPNVAIGRSYADSPDVDGCVMISHPSNLKTGDNVFVLIENADAYDLFGKLAKK